MFTVVTTLKTGGDYYKGHVYRLAKQVIKHNGGVVKDFVCFSDVDLDPIKTIPLKNNWPKWWSKLEMFYHDLGKVLNIDLDQTIKKDLTEIDNYDTTDGKFWGAEDLGAPGTLNNSVMLWEGAIPNIPESFTEDQIPNWQTKGRWVDQGFIEHKIKDRLNFLPYNIAYHSQPNYNATRNNNELVNNTTILIQAGQPKWWIKPDHSLGTPPPKYQGE
tara:strand:- start:47 stop:694 length:648 start_codon:yes stop_codon:yes gene_type:complete